MAVFLCTKRQVFCMALILPTFIYLMLMFAAIGQVCLKSDTEQLQFKEEYIKLLDYVQARSRLQLEPDDLSRQDALDARRFLHSQLSNASSSLFASNTYSQAATNKVATTLLYNCSTISRMKIRNKIGHGVSKQAFVADYHGTHVAIKMVTRHIDDVRKCLDQLKRSQLDASHISQNSGLNSLVLSKPERANIYSAIGELKSVYRNLHGKEGISSKQIPSDEHTLLPKQSLEHRGGSLKERQRCYTPPTARLMKEILLSQQLQHHNLAALLGYCVRSEESDSTDISEHGVISVYELGSRFVLDNLQILPWQTRLRHSIEMADLLTYLQNSPLGSLLVADLKEGHLVMINDSLKLIDLDDVNNLEPSCDAGDYQCPYNIRCERALCEGFNAKENLKNLNGLVFKRLLFPLTFPEQIIADIGQLNAKLDSLDVTAAELHRKLVQLRTFLTKNGMFIPP